MSAKGPSAPPDRVESYDRLVAAVPEVARKGATMPYTSVNGNMFSYLDASGSMALRLSAPDRATFIARFSTTLHDAYGHVQKEYVTVPPDLLDDTNRLLPYFEASYAYAQTLKPKPTKRCLEVLHDDDDRDEDRAPRSTRGEARQGGGGRALPGGGAAARRAGARHHGVVRDQDGPVDVRDL